MPEPTVILTLRPISRVESGERVTPLTLRDPGDVVVGRSAEADWPVPEPSVSRRHASVGYRSGRWFVTDLSSRHGTTINDRRIEPGEPVPIEPGDVIAFGGWRCSCVSGTGRPGITTPFAPMPAGNASISAIEAKELGGVAQRGLDVLMGLTASLDSAGDRERVAQAAAQAVRDATGCRRVVIVQPSSEDELTVLASTSEQSPRISRSLIEQAASHGMVQISSDGAAGDYGQSIIDLKIRSAICAPIVVGSSPSAFLMVDTRDAEGVVPTDAAAFCQSVCRLVALAFERLTAASIAERHRQLSADLEAARRAQELLSPPSRGNHGGVEYRFESVPGRIVAGDLFDAFRLGETSAAFFLGDVSGKGVGAAMLMAACQSQLRSQLISGAGLAESIRAVNADLFARTEASKFVTLVAGVIDASARTVQIVDAGHGFSAMMPADGAAFRIECDSGFPLGIVPDASYEVTSVDLPAGGGIVVFSDGAVEQPDRSGNQFGLEAVLDSISSSNEPEDAVMGLMQAVRSHAAGPLADDLTVAALWVP